MKYLFLIIVISFLVIKSKKFFYKKNKRILLFKNNFISKESKIEKIFSRNNERLIKDPNININIDIYENEQEITTKTKIHRVRLAKFGKSKLNEVYFYKDLEGKIYKFVNEKKEYI